MFGESDQGTTGCTNVLRRVIRQQTQSAQGMAIRARKKSQRHMISLGYLNHTSQSLTLFAEPLQCHLSEIFERNNTRVNCPKMKKAKYTELRDLINRDTFRVVLSTELPDDANLKTARHVLATKTYDDKEERYKARYVAGGHMDIMKDYLGLGAQAIQCVSVRIILVVAKIKGFCIWVVDVKLAYL